MGQVATSLTTTFTSAAAAFAWSRHGERPERSCHGSFFGLDFVPGVSYRLNGLHQQYE
jgi:hypothetical protein